MNQLKARLIYQEALRRLQDAETLSDSALLSEQSDSSYLLRLLGFELLLKLVYELDLHQPAPNVHFYEKIFEKLSSETQTRLLTLAGGRVGPSALASKPVDVLKKWGGEFHWFALPVGALQKYDGRKLFEGRQDMGRKGRAVE